MSICAGLSLATLAGVHLPTPGHAQTSRAENPEHRNIAVETGSITRQSTRQAGQKFAKAEDVLAFINGYNENMEPDRVPDAVHAMRRFGMLRDPEQAGIYIGFIAGVIGDNQTNARNLIERMFPLPPAAQVVLIKAIAYSQLPDWKTMLGEFAERMPARRVLIKRYLYQGGKTLFDLSMKSSPQVIDTHWGRYFATGRYEAALPIISVLAWATDKDDLEKLTIGSMAKWTLASNAARDKNLLDLFKSELNHQPENIRLELREIIEAAETFELSAIRKRALGAIDTLKAKGPESSRNLAWWGDTGVTTLAVGCVVASALGQVQLGLPCVIGGALSQAAVGYYKRTLTK